MTPGSARISLTRFKDLSGSFALSTPDCFALDLSRISTLLYCGLMGWCFLR